MGPLIQDLGSVLKGTTSLLSLKVGRNEFYLAPYVPSYSPSLTLKMGGLLSRRTQGTLTHANVKIILNKQVFIVSSGLRLSYLGHRVKKSVPTVNGLFIVSSGLRLSYLGHRVKKSVSTVNGLFIVSSGLRLSYLGHRVKKSVSTVNGSIN